MQYGAIVEVMGQVSITNTLHVSLTAHQVKIVMVKPQEPAAVERLLLVRSSISASVSSSSATGPFCSCNDGFSVREMCGALQCSQQELYDLMVMICFFAPSCYYPHCCDPLCFYVDT